MCELAGVAGPVDMPMTMALTTNIHSVAPVVMAIATAASSRHIWLIRIAP